MAAVQLPVADAATARATGWQLIRRHRAALAAAVSLFALAALAGLTGPWLLGRIIDAVTVGTTVDVVTWLVAGMLGALTAQAIFIYFAARRTMLLGELVFARLREDFIQRVTALPLSIVERAGTGDLVTRTTSDIDAVSTTIRFAVPQVLVSVTTILLTLVAAALASPLLALSLLVGIPILVVVTRWYLRRAPEGYRRMRSAYSVLNGSVTETVDGVRTIDALGLGARRRAALDDSIRGTYLATLHTLWLRTVLYPITSFAFSLPLLAALLWGGWLADAGIVTVGAVATIALYSVQLITPVENLIFWLDELQTGGAALARIIGIDEVPADRTATAAVPDSGEISLDNASYSYTPGHRALHGVTLHLRKGERLAIVGPSGAGKSTMGRILAGIHAPDEGSATVGGVPLVDRPLDSLRREVALVTQEHHVFVGTLADNVRLGRADATRDQVHEALAAVNATQWVDTLPAGLDTVIGSGGHPLTPAQAQELALARLVLADPHTLVLDEATSLLNPNAARSLERSLAAVLRGRTVVAIAHRLHTAHDADRIAVVENGRITELGSHDELLARGGSYAALWHSWRDDG